MEMFKRIRQGIGRAVLRQRHRKAHRIKKFNNLRNSHKIAVAWEGSNIDEFEQITRFYQEMQKIGIQVDIICYFPGKVLPDTYTAIRYLNCIKQSDLNFFFIPKSADVTEFINTPYEILIDINNRNYFPIEYISALSKSEFKVGSEHLKYRDKFDMTIKIPDNSKPGYYLQQVKHYLEMINTGT